MTKGKYEWERMDELTQSLYNIWVVRPYGLRVGSCN